MSEDGRTDKTFFIRTPADLLEKLHWEANALWCAQPFDLQQRAYMVMNCAITAWQMKDWAYNALEAAERLGDLDVYAGRHIKSREDFGVYLMDANPHMSMACQIATASKHLQIEEHLNDPDIQTTVESVEINLHGGYQRDELFVVDGQKRIVAHVLMHRLYIRWKKVLYDLGLIPKEEPFVPDGDMQLPPGTPRLRRKRSQ
jgi:hypothetical protein